MEPRVMLGSMWFRTFARKTCKQRKTKHAGALHCLFSHINTSLKNFLSLSFFLAICRVLQRDTVTELWVCVPRNSPSVFWLYVYVSQDPKTHFNLLKQTNNADFDTSLVLRLVQKKQKNGHTCICDSVRDSYCCSIGTYTDSQHTHRIKGVSVTVITSRRAQWSKTTVFWVKWVPHWAESKKSKAAERTSGHNVVPWTVSQSLGSSGPSEQSGPLLQNLQASRRLSGWRWHRPE